MREETTRRRSMLAGGVLAALAVLTLVAALVDMRASAENLDSKDPTVMESKHDFRNETATEASDLHVEFSVPVKVAVVDVTGSTCPTPVAVEDGGPLVAIDWGEKCVSNDGLTNVSLVVISKEVQAEVISFFWTNSGIPIGVTPGPSPTPTDDIMFPTLPPATPTDLGPPATIPLETPVPPVDTATPTDGPPPVPPTDTLTPTLTPTAPTSTPTPTAKDTTVPLTPTPGIGNGDVNCNDLVDSIDALLVLQLIAQLVQSLECEFAADVNQNGVVDSIDVALLLQFVANLIPALPATP